MTKTSQQQPPQTQVAGTKNAGGGVFQTPPTGEVNLQTEVRRWGLRIILALVAIFAIMWFNSDRAARKQQAAEAKEAAAVARVEQENHLQHACGSQGEPVCTCQGVDVVTRYLLPHERIVLNTKGGDTGYWPSPSPTGIKICREEAPDECTEEAGANFRTGWLVIIENKSGERVPLKCASQP